METFLGGVFVEEKVAADFSGKNFFSVNFFLSLASLGFYSSPNLNNFDFLWWNLIHAKLYLGLKLFVGERFANFTTLQNDLNLLGKYSAM